MSWQATNWARTVTTGSPARKVILLLLADLGDEAHTCFPGQDRLAADSEQSTKSVARHLAALEADGIIRREARYVTGPSGKKVRTSDRFRLPVDEPGGRFPVEAPTGGPDGDLTDNLSGRSEGDLPDNQGPTYRTRVSEEPPVDPPAGPVAEVVPQPQGARVAGVALPGERDEHGVTSPECRSHRGMANPPACPRCATQREQFEVAQRRRAAAARRAEAAAAIQRDRQDKNLAVDPTPTFKQAADRLRRGE